jgi:hypothetical protein
LSTTPDNDTDPSTPGAKRASDPRAAAEVFVEDANPPPSPPPASPGQSGSPGLSASPGSSASPGLPRPKPTTDPGVAPPPSEQLTVPRQPMGIVVPAVARSVNDSVEILLEGMDRTQPERPRATSQSAGQAVASYHGEHAVRAPQPLPDDEPKVVIERRLLAQTLRVARSKAGRKKTAIQAASPKPSTPIGRRMLIAVVAGLAVVSVIFVALRRGSSGFTSAAGASRVASDSVAAAAPPAHEHAKEVSPAQELAMPVAVAPPAESQSPAATSASSRVTRKPPSPWQPAKPKLKPLPAETSPNAPDLGEFRTSF